MRGSRPSGTPRPGEAFCWVMTIRADILSALVGARISLLVGVASVCLSVLIGVTLGLTAGSSAGGQTPSSCACAMSC